jgi:hypothetical protein
MSDDLKDPRKQEIEQNLAFFLKELPTLLATHRGKFALLRHQQIINYFDTPQDAVTAAKQYDDQLYSIQQVTDTAVNLGYFSYAVRLAAA